MPRDYWCVSSSPFDEGETSAKAPKRLFGVRPAVPQPGTGLDSNRSRPEVFVRTHVRFWGIPRAAPASQGGGKAVPPVWVLDLFHEVCVSCDAEGEPSKVLSVTSRAPLFTARARRRSSVTAGSTWSAARAQSALRDGKGVVAAGATPQLRDVKHMRTSGSVPSGTDATASSAASGVSSASASSSAVSASASTAAAGNGTGAAGAARPPSPEKDWKERVKLFGYSVARGAARMGSAALAPTL